MSPSLALEEIDVTGSLGDHRPTDAGQPRAVTVRSRLQWRVKQLLEPRGIDAADVDADGRDRNLGVGNGLRGPNRRRKCRQHHGYDKT